MTTNSEAQGKKCASGQPNEFNKSQAGNSDNQSTNNDPDKITKVDDDTAPRYSANQITEHAYANVNILRGTFRPEEMDMEKEAPSYSLRSTVTPAVWKKNAFPKKFRRRRQRRRYIRQLQETARNLSNAHCTKEYLKCGSPPGNNGQTELTAEEEKFYSTVDTRNTCFKCGGQGHLAKYCHEIPNRQMFRRWRAFRRQNGRGEERENCEEQQADHMDLFSSPIRLQ